MMTILSKTELSIGRHKLKLVVHQLDAPKHMMLGGAFFKGHRTLEYSAYFLLFSFYIRWDRPVV